MSWSVVAHGNDNIKQKYSMKKKNNPKSFFIFLPFIFFLHKREKNVGPKIKLSLNKTCTDVKFHLFLRPQ